MSLRSPLGRVLGLGSARTGADHWWAQRVSAVALVPLTIWFVVSMLALGTLQHPAVIEFVGRPLNGFLMLLLVSSLAYHSYLGISVIIEDYVHAPATKIGSLLVARFAHVVAAAAALFAILRIVVGNHTS